MTTSHTNWKLATLAGRGDVWCPTFDSTDGVESARNAFVKMNRANPVSVNMASRLSHERTHFWMRITVRNVFLRCSVYARDNK